MGKKYYIEPAVEIINMEELCDLLAGRPVDLSVLSDGADSEVFGMSPELTIGDDQLNELLGF